MMSQRSSYFYALMFGSINGNFPSGVLTRKLWAHAFSRTIFKYDVNYYTLYEQKLVLKADKGKRWRQNDNIFNNLHNCGNWLVLVMA